MNRKTVEQQLMAVNQQLMAKEQQLRVANHDLGERIKELNCLYGLSKLVDSKTSLDSILQGVCDLIKESWQYPDITCASIVVEGNHYKTANFKKSQWSQSANILVDDKVVGQVEVFYLDNMPELDVGPFLQEERLLLGSLAERLGKIIKRIRAEKSRNEANIVINKSGLVIFTWRAEDGWPVDFVTDNVRNLLGYSPEEFFSGRVVYSSCIHPDDLEKVNSEVAMFSKDMDHEEFVHEPYRLITKDGSVKIVNDWTHISRDQQGNITHFKGIIEDITERKQAEDALRESEEKLTSLYNFMSEGVCVHEIIFNENNEAVNYRILDCNPKYEEILDLKKEDVINKSATEIYGVNDPPYLEIYTKVALTGEPSYLTDTAVSEVGVKQFLRASLDVLWNQLN